LPFTGPRASRFLPPFASRRFYCPPLSPITQLRYYEGSDSRRRHLDDGSLRLLRFAFLAFRPQPRKLSASRFLSRLSAGGCSRLRRRIGGSPQTHAETGSLSYGPQVRLQLLPTPPHGDAVTFDFRANDRPARGLPPRRQSVLADALSPGKAGGFKIGGPSKGPRFPTFDDVPEYTLVARHFITLSALLHRSEGTGPYAQSMGAPPRVDFLRDRDPRARIPPEMSNFYCRPGKAGGSPMI